MEDCQIIELYFSRSESAITETQKKYSSLCMSIAHNILNSREDSEECLNDTWLRTWNAIPPERPESLAAYLGRITRNSALSFLRKKNASKRNGGQYALCIDELAECLRDETGGISEGFAVSDAINRFLRQLKLETRKVFVMRYWYVMSIKDIAGELSLSESGVKVSLMRTRDSLRSFLEKEGIEI